MSHFINTPREFQNTPQINTTNGEDISVAIRHPSSLAVAETIEHSTNNPKVIGSNYKMCILNTM